MNTEKLVRAIFLIFALGIFVIQIKDSIDKYLDPPVLQTMSMISTKDLPKSPIFYVCEENQRMASKYPNYGYSDFAFSGLLSNGTISWSGQYGNSTFQDIVDDIYQTNYTSLEVRNGTSEHETFLLPTGYCKIINFSGILPRERIGSEKRIRFIITDPAKANDLRTEETMEAKVTLGKLNGDFEWKRVEASYELNDATLGDGDICTDYERYNSSYGSCIRDVLRKTLLEVYGCIPPWAVKDNVDR